MKDKIISWLIVALLGASVCALVHAVFLYFFIYGDVVHYQLTPKQWFSMYGINFIVLTIGGIVAGILDSKA